MKKLIFVVIIMLVMAGCSKNSTSKSDIYVPSRWTVMEYVKEIRSVWFVNSKEININDIQQMRKVVQRIWEADRDGKTLEEIDKAFEDRTLNDVLENGI